jgi:hypothetical protein
LRDAGLAVVDPAEARAPGVGRHAISGIASAGIVDIHLRTVGPGFVEKERSQRVLALVVPRGVNAALVETLGFIGVSALLQVALLICGLRLDAVVGLAL